MMNATEWAEMVNEGAETDGRPIITQIHLLTLCILQ